MRLRRPTGGPDRPYGPERLQCDLAENGIQVGICRIRRIRKKLGIRCKQKRKFKATTDSRHKLPVAKNLLSQQFKVSRPNTVWASDITYVPTDEGWLYLAGHKDLFNGEIVGYLDLPLPNWRVSPVLTRINVGPAAPQRLEEQLLQGEVRKFALSPKLNSEDSKRSAPKITARSVMPACILCVGVAWLVGLVLSLCS